MCFRPLSTLPSTLAAAVLLVATGCSSMNGYMMNASGLGYYEQGNYAMAAREFQQALASNPRNPDYIANLAKTKMKTGDAAGAEQLYQQALTLAPSHQPAYHGYAELLMAQNRSQEALRMLNAWAATQPYLPESHVELAWLQRELGQHDAAAQSLQTALQMNPNHATALAHLGQYHQDQGDAATAVALYQRALRADWNQPEVHSRLAVAAQSAGSNSPMAEIAMARGVHPGSLPRQQLALGPPPAGLPQAGMPGRSAIAAHTPAPMQHSFHGIPAVAQTGLPLPPNGNVGPLAGPVEFDQGQQSFAPVFSHSSEPQNAAGPVVSQHFPGPGSVPFGLSGAAMSGPTLEGSSTGVPSGSATSTLPAPIPDPAFSSHSTTPAASDIPVTSISSSKAVSDDVPQVEAF